MQLAPEEIRSSSDVTVLAVVVLYRCLPMESSSLITLLADADQATIPHLRLKIVVADNTPGGQSVSGVSSSFEYRAYPDNPGLTQPYNDALAQALEQGFDWLLTLDQDTHLPPGFLASVAKVARSYSDLLNVAAIVPRIEDSGRLISPFRFMGGFFPVLLPASLQGISPLHTSALNSASLLRVQLLKEMGGYDLNFPLHNSDTRLYQQIDKLGKSVVIMDITVPHELSILRREERISPKRYRQMLRDECEFWDRHMNVFGRTERMVRLLGRYAKGVLRRENEVFQNVTISEIRYRLMTRRINRLRQSKANALYDTAR